MSDPIRRAIRTFLQGFVGVLALVAVPLLSNIVSSVVNGGNDVMIDLNIWKNIGIAAIAGGVISLVAFVQNALEDRSGKALLK